jgi:heme o synthase
MTSASLPAAYSLAGNAELPATASMRDYFTLLKPGVMSLVVFTAACGMWLAPTTVHPLVQMVSVLCIALGSGAGAAINMWYDRDIDAIMRRTQKRPIPAGRVHADDALFLGLFLSVFSVGLLGLAAGWKAAGLLAFAIWFYAHFYTMMLKRHTPQNIVIGGAAGAFPPVIGWLAASAPLSLEPWVYFLVIFLWTPPHFWALALYRHDDYRTANVPMMPLVRGIASTKRQMLVYTVVLVALTLTPTVVLHSSGWLYGAGAAALGAGFVWHARRVLRRDEPALAMKMFGYSIVYLFALFGLLLLDRALLPWMQGSAHGLALGGM